MTQSSNDEFANWLAKEMQDKLKIDDSVMSEYLVGIVTLDSTTIDEKKEGMVDFLTELTVCI